MGARGTVNEIWVEKLVEQDRYIHQLPPKSTGRELYTKELAQSLWSEGLSYNMTFEDIVVTVTSYTARSLALNFKKFIDPLTMVEEVLVGGGGVHNRTLMSMLRDQLKQRVTTMDEWEFSSDAKEAIAFTILGNEFLHGNTNNLPSATGASRNVVMGKLVLP
ncbi:MAG: anhydro-N-acetylmuramic acid kinase [Bacilli bacterium]